MTGITNKKQYRGGKDNNNRITNSWLAKTALAMEEGDDPRTVILELEESKDEGEKVVRTSFIAYKNMIPNRLVIITIQKRIKFVPRRR